MKLCGCVSAPALHSVAKCKGVGGGGCQGLYFEDSFWEPECRALEAPNRLSGGPTGLQSLWNLSLLCAGQAPELTLPWQGLSGGSDPSTQRDRAW